MKKILVLLLAVLMLFAFVACDTGNGGSGGTGGSTDGNPAAYVGMWTGTMGPVTVSITLNADGSLLAYNSAEGYVDGSWSATESGVSISFGDVETTGKLENGKLVINFDGENIYLEKSGSNSGSGSTGGTGSGSRENGENSGSGSTEGNISYVGTWTVTMGSDQMSVTLNTDGSCVAYNSDEGFAEANWNVTNSGGVRITIPGVGSLDGKLENGKLVVNYMGQDVPLTKVDTAAYVGTWTGSMGGATLSITLNADGTMSGYSPIMNPSNIDGFWTVTNDGVMIGADVGDEDPEEGIIPGSLQGDKLVINFNGQIELTK